MSREGEDVVDIEPFKEKICNFTESFKFNKVVSEFMILVNNNSASGVKFARTIIFNQCPIQPDFRSVLWNGFLPMSVHTSLESSSADQQQILPPK
jgi:hypothetical protein